MPCPVFQDIFLQIKPGESNDKLTFMKHFMSRQLKLN